MTTDKPTCCTNGARYRLERGQWLLPHTWGPPQYHCSHCGSPLPGVVDPRPQKLAAALDALDPNNKLEAK